MNDALHPPAKLGRYEILEQIGQGMMGVVYKALDPVLGRWVALKAMRLSIPIIDAERELLEQRFLQEAHMAAGLSHPNIVVVHDVGRDPVSETPFMALEYLDGRTLAQVLARGGVSHWREAVRMAIQLADALHHAHSRGIVHRDVKPSNIMVVASCTPKILDFGIAKASAAQLTADGQCWGTPSYMSPEQALGAPVDQRSDLFSLGSVLYELLTGRRAFGGANIPQIMTRVAHEHPDPPSRVQPSLPAELDTIVMRALSKRPAERYAAGRELADDLEDVLVGRSLRPRAGWAPPVLAGSTPQRDHDHCGSPTIQLPTAAAGAPRILARVAPWGLSALLGVALGFTARELELGVLRRDKVATASLAGAVPSRPADQEPSSVTAAPTHAVPPAGSTASLTRLSAAVKAFLGSLRPLPPPPPLPGAEPAPAPRTKAPSARVALSVEHGFKHGRLKVWIDDTLVLEKALAANHTQSVLFFTRSKGSLAEVLDVTPGERMFRVEVEGDEDQHRGGQLPGVLRTEETRLLEVKVGGQMQLGWKS